MNPAERYRILQGQMLRGRACGTLSDAALDTILEDMDTAWDAMDDEARSVANAEAAKIAASSAPDDLRLVDCDVAIGTSSSVRRAA